MELDTAIRLFVDFLNSSWDIVSQLLSNRYDTSDENSIDDWLQANWELLVERKVLKVNEYLEIYGSGADYNGSSSRIIDPEALANFRVDIKTKKGHETFDLLNNEQVELQNMTFENFVGFKNGFYIQEPPFKYALITDDRLGIERVVAINDLQFELGKI